MRRTWEVIWRLALLVFAVVIIAAAASGCGGDSGPSWQWRQQEAIKTVAGVCRDHGGMGYINFSYHEEVDEASCADGLRLKDGEPVR